MVLHLEKGLRLRACLESIVQGEIVKGCVLRYKALLFGLRQAFCISLIQGLQFFDIGSSILLKGLFLSG